jgi:hypothetical protein
MKPRWSYFVSQKGRNCVAHGHINVNGGDGDAVNLLLSQQEVVHM